MTGTRPRRRRLVRLIVGAVVVLALLLVGGPFVYIHFIEGTAPKKLSLPADTSSKGHAGAAAPTGQWVVTSATTVGYRVSEVLVGQSQVAVGRTHSVTGTVGVTGPSVTAANFTVQMATVHSNEAQRDTQFDDRIMDVAQFPTATFMLTAPIALGRIPTEGRTIRATASGILMLHGQSHRVTFAVEARYTGTVMDINGSIPVLFSHWGIENPSFGSFVTTADHGTLEFLLVLQPSAA